METRGEQHQEALRQPGSEPGGRAPAPSLPRAVPVPMLLVGSRLSARSGGGFMAGSKPRLVLGRGMCAQSEPEILERLQLLVHRGVRREGSTAEVPSFFPALLGGFASPQSLQGLWGRNWGRGEQTKGPQGSVCRCCAWLGSPCLASGSGGGFSTGGRNSP